MVNSQKADKEKNKYVRKRNMIEEATATITTTIEQQHERAHE